MDQRTNASQTDEVTTVKNRKTVPDSNSRGLLVVFASFMIHFIIDGVTFSYGELLTEFLKKHGGGNAATSSVLSALIGTALCSGPISGALINVYGCRTVCGAGSVIAATFILLSSYATNIIMLAFMGLLTGFGFGLSYLSALISITYYFDKYISLATGIVVCGSGLGTIIFSSFFKLALKNIEIDHLLLITGVLVLTCVLFSLFFEPMSTVTETAPVDEINHEETLLTLTKTTTNKATVDDITIGIEKKRNNNSKTDLPTLNQPTAVIEEKGRNHLRIELEKTLNEITDQTVNKNPTFLLFALSNFLTSLGFDLPFAFIPMHSEEKGVHITVSLLSVIGVGNVIGRIVLTYICDYFNLNRLNFYGTSLLLCGMITIFSTYCYDALSLGIFCALYGLLISTYISFTTGISSDLFGKEKIVNVLGIISLFQGVAAFFGPPLAGALCDYYKNYNPAFQLGGIVIALSGLLLYPIPIIQRYLKSRPETGEVSEDEEKKIGN